MGEVMPSRELVHKAAFYSHLATRIKALRVERGLTQQATADLADLDRAELSRYETGQQLPNLATFWRLCRAFGVDPNYFFRGLP